MVHPREGEPICSLNSPHFNRPPLLLLSYNHHFKPHHHLHLPPYLFSSDHVTTFHQSLTSSFYHLPQHYPCKNPAIVHPYHILLHPIPLSLIPIPSTINSTLSHSIFHPSILFTPITHKNRPLRVTPALYTTLHHLITLIHATYSIHH